MSERLATMMVSLAEAATRRGLSFDRSETGCLEFKLGAFFVTVNGDRNPRKNSRDDQVPMYSALVYEGWMPVALCNPFSGMTLGGREPGDVEDAIIAACEEVNG